MKKLIVVLVICILIAAIVGTCVALYTINAKKDIQVSVEDPVVTLSINNGNNTAAQTDFTLEGFNPNARQQTKDITLACANYQAAGDVQGVFTVQTNGVLSPYLDISVNLLTSAGGSLGESITAAATGAGKNFDLNGGNRYIRITITLNNDGVNHFDLATEQTATLTLGWRVAPTAAIYGDEAISFHFLELGNNYTGDCVYIKAGDTDILIDAGSRQSSAGTIANYVSAAGRCTDGKLEYVIATHAHQDHIAGFVGTKTVPGIFDRYECGIIIDFARTDITTELYKNYVAKRDAEVEAGATHFTALQCYNNTDGGFRTYSLGKSMSMTVLYQRFYTDKSSDENNYSVCVLFTHGDKHYLFTGDLEEAGELSLVQSNDLPEVELFKAGHHGSPTSTNDSLLSVIKPKIVCVCCCAGSVEYTSNLANTFPSQAFVDRVAPYTDKVYVTTVGSIQQKIKDGVPQVDKKGNPVYEDTGFTSMNGNICVLSAAGAVTVNCSNNNTLLKDTDWFAANRTMPSAWAGGSSGGGPSIVQIPAADNTVYRYTGSAQTYQIAANNAYDVSGNVQTEIGTYTVTVALKDKTNSKWSDDSTADKSYTFTIKSRTDLPVSNTYGNADLSFHFLRVGSNSFSDCVYVKAGAVDVLINAGRATSDSLTAIKNYLNANVSGAIEYVIATQAAEYSLGGFNGDDGIFATYECGTIIDFPKKKTTATYYNNYVTARDAEVAAGAAHYTALECVNEANDAQSTYDLGNGMFMSILYQYYYDNNLGKDSDGSVCVLFTHGSKHFLFTGDLDSTADASLVANYALPKVDLYKAGNQGGDASSSAALLSEIDPEIIAINCYQTTSGALTQTFIDRIAPYTDKVYVTGKTQSGTNMMHGNIVVTSSNGSVTVATERNSGNLLKDIAWFTANRTMPSAWEGGGSGGVTLVSIPAADATQFVYNGSAQTYQIAANDAYTVTNNAKTNAGSYVVTVALKDKVNTKWTDDSTDDKEYAFTIAKASISEPAADQTVFKYTGSAQTYSIPANANYTVSGATQTAMAHHTVTVALNDAANYKWAASGNSNDLSYDFTINGKTVIPHADTYGDAEMSFHIMRLGGSQYGDSVYVKAGDTDILIDAGRNSSAANIKTYIDQFCTDGILEYVIVTHTHQLNIEGFTTNDTVQGIFDLYQCETIIEFSRSTASATTTAYKNARDAEVAAGAVCYTALQCVNETDGAQSTYALGTGMYMSVLYQSGYESGGSAADDYSVCVLFNHGDKYFLFTGDLKASGEASLVANNLLPEVALFKAGDQGKADGTSSALLDVIDPEIVVISCYPSNATIAQATLDNIAPYTELVYATGQTTSGTNVLNGNIVVTSSAGNVTVNCSNNNAPLKDNSAWFTKWARTNPWAS